jgi:hypothetical protein
MPDTHMAALARPRDEQTDASPAARELNTALIDAHQLLAHAASTGLLPGREPAATDAMIKDLIDAQEAARTGSLTPQIIAAFWIAYGRLAHIAGPVTAASLTASKLISLIGMKIQSTFLVAAIIVFSIFLFMSNGTLNETSDLIDQQNAAALKLWSDIQVLRTNPDTASAGDGNTVIAGRVFEETVEFSRKSAWLLQSASRLNFWFTPWWMTSSIENVTFNETNRQGMDHLNVPPGLFTAAEIRSEAIAQIRAYQSIRDYALGLYKINTLIYSSLSTYFLPTVYALLGAFLYGFRLYSRLIRRNTFLPSAAYSARYYIAAIAGLVVGLFASLLPKSLALPPLAVAFLVGYAVEAFFSRLDGLIRKLKASNGAVSVPRTAKATVGSSEGANA